MTLLGHSRRRAIAAPLLLLLISAAMALSPQVAQARSVMAMSGTFYSQNLELPQGVVVSSDSIYVVVFNQGDSEFTVHLTATTPPDVELSLSAQDFLLRPGEQRRVYIAIKVGENAVPGEYRLKLTAEAQRSSTGEGVQILTAAAQEASLKVTGEAGWIYVHVMSPEGDPVAAIVRLSKEIQGRLYEFASSQTGTLEAKVSLGHFVVSAYVAEEQLAEESVDILADNERKEVTLVVKTVYFANFGIVLNRYTETGELAFVKVVYQVRNLYQPINDVELILKVRKNGEALEDISLLSLSQLNLGDLSSSRDYVPPKGWGNGTYTFQGELYKGGKLYTTSLEDKLEIRAIARPVNWATFFGINGATLVIVGATASAIIVRRRHAAKVSGRR